MLSVYALHLNYSRIHDGEKERWMGKRHWKFDGDLIERVREITIVTRRASRVHITCQTTRPSLPFRCRCAFMTTSSCLTFLLNIVAHQNADFLPFCPFIVSYSLTAKIVTLYCLFCMYQLWSWDSVPLNLFVLPFNDQKYCNSQFCWSSLKDVRLQNHIPVEFSRIS